MKKFLALAAIFALVLAACENSADGNNETAKKGTLFVYAGTASSLEIKNDSKGYTFPDTFLNETNEVSITIKNTGDGTINLTGKPYINLDGATTVFSISAQPESSTISPERSISFKIRFSPVNATESYVYVSIPNDSKNEPDFSFTVYGNGIRPKPIAVVVYNDNEIPQNGTINAGETYITLSKSISVTIKNTGTQVLTIDTDNISITGVDKDVFSVTDTPAQSISIGGQSQLIIKWEPTKQGGNNATLKIPTNDISRSLVEVYLQAQAATGAPVLQLTQGTTVITNNSLTPFSFGAVRVGNSTSLTFTIKNTGNIALELTGDPAVGSSNTVFSITAQPTGNKLNPNETQDFVIQYTPTVEGVDNVEITINNNGNEKLFKLNARGNGTVPRPSAVILYGSGEIHQDGIIDAGDIILTLSKDITVSVKNSGDANLTLETANITITGADAASFTRLTTPGSTILAGTTTSFNIKCEPIKAGEHRAVLTIPTNDISRNPVTVNLKANGVQGYPVLELRQGTTLIANNSLTPFDFGRVVLDGSKSLSFTIKNTGNINLSLTGTPIVTSSNAAFTVLTQPANTILSPGASTEFSIGYIPTAEDVDSGYLTILNNGGGAFILNIKGTGYIKRPQITVSQGSTIINQSGEYNFGAVALGDPKDTIFTIENSGELNLVFETVNNNRINLENNSGNTFTVTNQPSSAMIVAHGNTTTFSIRFNPVTVGSNFDAIVKIKTNSQYDGEFTFTVKGNSYERIPNVPTGVSATALSSSSISVSWNPVSGAQNYKVYYGTNSSSITSLASSTVTGTSYIHNELQAETTYYYRIIAANSGGDSDYSSTVSATTKLASPTGVTVTPQSTSSIRVSWNAVPSATSYKVYYETDSSTDKILATTVTGTSFTHTGLQAGIIYNYYIVAVKTGSESAYSTCVFGEVVPAIPTNVTAVDTNLSQIRISWNAVPGAVGYKIYCARNSSSSAKIDMLEPGTLITQQQYGAGSGYTLGKFGLYGGGTDWSTSTWYFWVTAVNSSGVESGYSSVVYVSNPKY